MNSKDLYLLKKEEYENAIELDKENMNREELLKYNYYLTSLKEEIDFMEEFFKKKEFKEKVRVV